MKKTISTRRQTKVAHHEGTFSEVFIIESVSLDDEIAGRSEGKVLCDTLRLSNQTPRYIHFQKKEELPHIIELFKLSKYRYLHFSCHGNPPTGFKLQEGNLTFGDFAKTFNNSLAWKRLFVSACNVGNKDLLSALQEHCFDFHSVVAPVNEIGWGYAPIIWAALYASLIDPSQKGKINAEAILDSLRKLKAVFPYTSMGKKQPMQFFTAYRNPTNPKMPYTQKTI